MAERPREQTLDTGETDGEGDSARDASLPAADPAHYTLEEEIGRGGLGRLMRASDRRLNRTVAIKLMRRLSTRLEARFRREVEITARLQHPGIVPIHEAGRWPSGEPYYTMKLISGASLKQVLSSLPSLTARLPLLSKLLSVCEAIGYAHSQNVVHRDIKPANIMIGAFGEAVVIDWGVAKVLGTEDLPPAVEQEAAEAATATTTGAVVGTPAYMPPEQARGEPVDRTADVYSLGAVLYELLAGRAAFQGASSAEVVRAVIDHAPRPLAELAADAPEELVTIAAKAMAREPGRRYPDAGALAADLKRFLDGQLVGAHRYSSRELVRRWLARNRRAVAIAALASLAVLVTLVVSVGRVIGERDLARAAQATAEARGNDLLLAQARLLVENKPTEAIAYLKRYAAQSRPDWPAVFSIAADARSRIVAGRVFRGLELTRVSPDGTRAAAVENGRLTLIDLARAESTVVREGAPLATHLAISDDALAARTADGTIRKWALPGGPERTLGRVEEEPTRVTILDAHTTAVAGASGTIYVLEDGGARVALRGHSTPVRWVAYDAASRTLASVGADETVRLWSLPDGKPRARLELSAWYAAFSPDGRTLALAGMDGVVTLVDVASGKRRVLAGHHAQVARVRFSADGRTLFTSSADQTIRVWDLASGTSRVLTGHQGFVEELALSRDGRLLASASEDQTIRVWDLALGESLVLRGHDDFVVSIGFSADGSRLVSADHSGQVRVWQLPRPPLLVPTPTAPIDFAPRRDGAFWALGDGWLRAYEPSGAGVRELERRDREGLRGPLAATSDGARVAATEAGALLLFDAAAKPGAAPRELRGHQGAVNAMVFSPDGATLASGGEDRAVRLWNTRDGTPRATLTGHRESIWFLEFSPDGKWLASAGDEPGVRLWALANGGARELPAADMVYGVSFSGDSRRVAWTTGDRTASVLELDGAHAPRTLAGHAAVVRAVALSPDGERLATGADDHTARLCLVDGGEGCSILPHGGPVRVVRFSADGRTLLTASDDRTVHLWDVATAAELSVVRAERTFVSARLTERHLIATFKDEPFARVWPTALTPPSPSVEWLEQLSSAALRPDDTVSSPLARK